MIPDAPKTGDLQARSSPARAKEPLAAPAGRRRELSLDPGEIVSGHALLPGVRGPSPSDLRRFLERIPERGFQDAAFAAGVRPRHVRRIARADPEVFGQRLTEALAAYREGGETT